MFQKQYFNKRSKCFFLRFDRRRSAFRIGIKPYLKVFSNVGSECQCIRWLSVRIGVSHEKVVLAQLFSVWTQSNSTGSKSTRKWNNEYCKPSVPFTSLHSFILRNLVLESSKSITEFLNFMVTKNTRGRKQQWSISMGIRSLKARPFFFSLSLFVILYPPWERLLIKNIRLFFLLSAVF